MNLIISFSARENGSCDQIANFIRTDADSVLSIRNQNIHPCTNCDYECFRGQCKYRNDDVYGIYDRMCSFDKVILIVPMYCGNPCSLYFSFHERCQDYFMHNDNYDEIIQRLYIIGIYGSSEETPDFLPCFQKWFADSPCQDHVLGIQRHLLGQRMADSVLDSETAIAQIRDFLSIRG